jgi:DNA-binding NarL/FixJ family response regulator
MPGCDGLCATRQIMAEMPECKIVILTTSTDNQDLFEAVISGAHGYLLKSMDADELVECLEQARQGIPPFSPGLGVRLLNVFARPAGAGTTPQESGLSEAPEATPASKLTPRQRQVLDLVAQDYSYKETAQKLGLSQHTIKNHMTEIMDLLHLEHRAQVLAYAGRLGLDNQVLFIVGWGGCATPSNNKLLRSVILDSLSIEERLSFFCP